MYILQAAVSAISPSPAGLSPGELKEADRMLEVFGFTGLLLLVSFVLWVWALVHILRNENFKNGTTKVLWALFVFFVYGIGALCYLLFGRPKKLK